jgi:hypothetical protein
MKVKESSFWLGNMTKSRGGSLRCEVKATGWFIVASESAASDTLPAPRKSSLFNQ